MSVHSRFLIRYFSLFLFVLLLSASLSYAREVTDMSGRRVIVPDVISRVYSSSPTATYMIYAIDPDLIIGLNSPVLEHERPYLKKSFQELPVIGGFFGQGNTPNMEMIIKAKPDIIITWTWQGSVFDKKAAESMERFHIPVINTTVDTISGYSDAFMFFGKLLGREKRAAELNEYTKKIFNEIEKIISSIPEGDIPSVYYAEGRDGLYTECEGSLHCELIPMAGGRNASRCIGKSAHGMERYSFEQVMLIDPEIIITGERSFYARVFKDTKWRNLRAVKTKRVYLIPRVPFNWFDRPPSLMRILGLQWLTGCFHPDLYKKDIIKETVYFLKLFFNIVVSEEKIREIINQ